MCFSTRLLINGQLRSDGGKLLDFVEESFSSESSVNVSPPVGPRHPARPGSPALLLRSVRSSRLGLCFEGQTAAVTTASSRSLATVTRL